MKYFLLASALCFFVIQSVAQQTPKLKTYKIYVTDSGARLVGGYLYDITDSSVKISQWPVALGSGTSKVFREITQHQISEVVIKRSHGAGRGAWQGALVGTLLGVIAGFIDGDDPEEYWFRFSASDKAIIYGGLAGAAGTGIGALVGGLAKKRFIIGGNSDRFRHMKINVLNKTYGNLPNPAL